MRHCTKCGRTPDETPFGKNGRAKDGLESICKACLKVLDAVYMKRYYQKNRNRIIAYSIRYQKEHPWVKRDHYHKSLARLREAYVESINAHQVFERDGWICQL